MSTSGRRLLSSLVRVGDVHTYLKMGLEKSLFKDGEALLYEAINKHLSKFGTIPKQATIEAWPGMSDAIVEAPEPPKFYLEEVEKRYLHNTLKAGVQEITSLLTQTNPEEALEVFTRVTTEMYKKKQRKHVTDFRDAAEIVYEQYVTQKAAAGVVGLPFGWPTLDDMSGGARKGDFISIVGRPMMGKLASLDSLVLTLKGYKKMRDVKIGDKIASVDGAPSVVTGLFPQGVKSLYRMKFQDGRVADTGAEHLWEVWYRDWDEPKIMTTMQVMEKMEKVRYQKRLSIRMFTGDYGVAAHTPFSPYLLGAFLGHGQLYHHMVFHSNEKWVTDKIASELSLNLIYFDTPKDGTVYPILDGDSLKKWFTSLGLWGCKAPEKFIPRQCFEWSRVQRIALLQGLLDTDGMAEKRGGISYSTRSPQLSLDVQELVRSLGGRATVSVHKTYTGEYAYDVYVVMEDRKECFTLPRKLERVHHDRICKINHRLRIDSVEYIGEAECQCISVSHPDHLYVMDDYVVTHNTFKMLYTAHHGWRAAPRRPLFVSMEMMADLIHTRLAAMDTKTKLTNLMKAQLSTASFNKMMGNLQELKGMQRPLWVVDGNIIKTVDDIIMQCQILQPDCVWIDAAYLLKHKNARMGKWDKQSENAEMIKEMIATDLEVPVICSYQLSKESAKSKKKNKDDKATMEDIYGSDAIAQLSSVILGLFQFEDDVEALNKRRVQILKGRSGETGEFTINWDFSAKMDFSEYKPEKPEEVQMNHLG